MSTSIDSIFSQKFDIKNIEDVYNKLGNKNSKGIDKIGHYVFDKIKKDVFKIINTKVLNGSYQFSPYLENLKLKGRNKVPRIISIPTIRDRIVLSILKDILHETFSERINRKLPNKYIADIKKYVKSNTDVHYFKTDIQKFYDRIDRSILMGILGSKIKNVSLLRLLENSIKNITTPNNLSFPNKSDYFNEYGVPQGLSISNALAQIYLTDFDSNISNRNLLYLRYVDDILILTKRPLAEYRINNIKTHLAAKNLETHGAEKTSKGKLTDDIDYLGYRINDKIISVSFKSIQNFISSITGLFTHYKRGYLEKSRRSAWLTNDDITYNSVFIENLNELITGSRSENKNYGWLFFFSEITDENLLFRLDKIISGFFISCNAFGNKRPSALKRLVRTYYEIRFNPKSPYINDYNLQDTPSKKQKYLIFRGQIDPNVNYSISEIEFHYEKFKKKQLRKLEKDIGYSYI